MKRLIALMICAVSLGRQRKSHTRTTLTETRRSVVLWTYKIFFLRANTEFVMSIGVRMEIHVALACTWIYLLTDVWHAVTPSADM